MTINGRNTSRKPRGRAIKSLALIAATACTQTDSSSNMYPLDDLSTIGQSMNAPPGYSMLSRAERRGQRARSNKRGKWWDR